MRSIFYMALPYSKEEVTLALESGVDGIIVPNDRVAAVKGLARSRIVPEKDATFITLAQKADEENAAALIHENRRAVGEKNEQGETDEKLVVLNPGWEIIPLENLLASAPEVAVAVQTEEEARLACGVLERGVDTLVVTPQGLLHLKSIVAAVKYSPAPLDLVPAVITAVTQTGMGHRVCVDTTSILRTGQGMLVGNSAAFTFLVNAETEHNEYVASRPFRINAGAVHAYAVMPGDRTAYLDELAAGSEVLITDHKGAASIATVGRVKVERRPMLLIEAKAQGAGTGAVFLQNAETIRMVRPDGTTVSVVDLAPGDSVLCRIDVAGRHFGMRIAEDIKEE